METLNTVSEVTEVNSAVELVKVLSHFKAVTDKTSPHFGKKRESVSWAFVSYKELAPAASPELIAVVNEALEQYGKKLIATKAGDWDYKPVESDITVEKLAAHLASTGTRTRAVTNKTLEAAGKFYAVYTEQLLGKEAAKANAGGAIIGSRLKPILNNVGALQVVGDTITQLLEAVAESDDEEILVEYAEVSESINWTVKLIDELVLSSESDMADSL